VCIRPLCAAAKMISCLCARAGCSAEEFEALVQRNLGANAGLDYRELRAFLAAIIDREQAALMALLGDAADELSASGPCDSCEANPQQGEIVASASSHAGRCPSAPPVDDGSIHRLWQRTDCVTAVMHAISDEPRRAAVLQTLFNLSRAHSAVVELRTDGIAA